MSCCDPACPRSSADWGGLSLRQPRVCPTFSTRAGHLQHGGHFELRGSPKLLAVGGGRGADDRPVGGRRLGVRAAAAGTGISPRHPTRGAGGRFPELRVYPTLADGIAV